MGGLGSKGMGHVLRLKKKWSRVHFPGELVGKAPSDGPDRDFRKPKQRLTQAMPSARGQGPEESLF